MSEFTITSDNIRSLISNVCDKEKLHLTECIKLLIPVSEYNIHLIQRCWDLFRMTDPICLSKYPDNQHIYQRLQEENKPLNDKEFSIFMLLNKYFSILIDLPHKNNMLLFISNIPDAYKVVILKYGDKFQIAEFSGEIGVNFPNGLPTDIFVTIDLVKDIDLDKLDYPDLEHLHI